MGNERHNTGRIGALGVVKKGMEKFTQQMLDNIKIQEATEDQTTWNIEYPKKGTIHQIDFCLILTMGQVFMLYYGVKLKKTTTTTTTTIIIIIIIRIRIIRR